MAVDPNTAETYIDTYCDLIPTFIFYCLKKDW